MKKITLLFAVLMSSSMMFSQTVLTEDFENSGNVPTGWTVDDLALNTPPEVWTFETGGEAGGFTPGNTLVYDNGGDGFYATFDSDGYGNNSTVEESLLTSPVFDCSSLTSVTLSFATFYNGSYGGLGEIEVFDGSSWVNIQTYSTDLGGSAPTVSGIQTFDVPELVGVANAQVRFRWTGNWSLSWSIDNISVFQCTVSAPDAVSAVSPANSGTDIDINYGGTTNNLGPFEWMEPATGDPADTFNINLGETTAGDDIGTIPGFDSGGSINYGWQPNTTYYWSIESVNCAGSTTSPVFSFTTSACTETAAPAAVTAPTPADGATDVSVDADGNAVIFSWTGDADADFILNFGTANPPAQSFNFFESGDPLTGIQLSTTYYWSVDAVNCFGITPGTVYSFTTAASLSVEENELAAFSVYPNPTSGLLNIKSSKEIDNVEVFNLLGQNVSSFKGDSISNSSIDLSDLSKGLYLVKISSGDKTQTIRVNKE